MSYLRGKPAELSKAYYEEKLIALDHLDNVRGTLASIKQRCFRETLKLLPQVGVGDKCPGVPPNRVGATLTPSLPLFVALKLFYKAFCAFQKVS